MKEKILKAWKSKGLKYIGLFILITMFIFNIVHLMAYLLAFHKTLNVDMLSSVLETSMATAMSLTLIQVLRGLLEKEV